MFIVSGAVSPLSRPAPYTISLCAQETNEFLGGYTNLINFISTEKGCCLKTDCTYAARNDQTATAIYSAWVTFLGIAILSSSIPSM